MKSTVPRVEAVMLTMLLPTRMVESRRSKSSASARADAARRLPVLRLISQADLVQGGKGGLGGGKVGRRRRVIKPTRR